MSGRQDWLFGRRTVHARAEIDLEDSYAVPAGVAIRPGDIVQVHGAPTAVAFGERVVTERPATVRRAGSLLRAWTSFTALFQLTELYEVGFEPKETP